MAIETVATEIKRKSDAKEVHNPSDLFAKNIFQKRQSSARKLVPDLNDSKDVTPPEEREQKDLKIKQLSMHTLKDVDLENMIMGELLKIEISEADRHLIITTLERDAEYLEKWGLMDYSLLFGIEKVEEDDEIVQLQNSDPSIHRPAKESSGGSHHSKHSNQKSRMSKAKESSNNSSVHRSSIFPSSQSHANERASSVDLAKSLNKDTSII